MKTLVPHIVIKASLWLIVIINLNSCKGQQKEAETDKHALAEKVGLVGSPEGEVWIKRQDSTLQVIVAPETAQGIFETAELSPNKKFVLLTVPLGDFGEAWVYQVKNGALYKVEGGFGLGKIGWLKDSRILLHQGCVLATYCKKLESVSNKTPWIVKVTEDLDKEN